MLIGLIRGLAIAWILSLLDFDKMFINATKEVFDVEVSKDLYYVIFAFIGLVSHIF